MLRMKDVDSFYGGSYILHNVNLDVEWGRLHSMVGRNGVGKTTLYHTCTGLTIPMLGRLHLGRKGARWVAVLEPRSGLSHQLVPDTASHLAAFSA
mgnify:CR=1 FL=1